MIFDPILFIRLRRGEKCLSRGIFVHRNGKSLSKQSGLAQRSHSRPKPEVRAQSQKIVQHTGTRTPQGASLEGFLLSEAQNLSLAGHAWPTAYFLIPSTALHLTALVKQSRASSIRSILALNANGSQGVRGGSY